MLAYARSRLDRSGLAHAQLRHGDIYDVPVEDNRADAVVMHQVLHFLSDPQRAVREAARVLAPGGSLLIVDFAPHELEFLREQYAHRRLGFSPDQLKRWFKDAGIAVKAQRDLAPDAEVAGEKLTVSLTLGAKPGVASGKTKSASVEFA
jgi:ArsR family transcriptional regulator